MKVITNKKLNYKAVEIPEIPLSSELYIRILSGNRQKVVVSYFAKNFLKKQTCLFRRSGSKKGGEIFTKINYFRNSLQGKRSNMLKQFQSNT